MMTPTQTEGEMNLIATSGLKGPSLKGKCPSAGTRPDLIPPPDHLTVEAGHLEEPAVLLPEAAMEPEGGPDSENPTCAPAGPINDRISAAACMRILHF